MKSDQSKLETQGLPIATVLTVAIGSLVAAVIVVVLVVSYTIARRNTIELVQERAGHTSGALAARLRDYLLPARNQVAFLAEMLAADRAKTANQAALNEVLYASLAGLSQASSVAFVRRDFQVIRAFRRRPHQRTAISDWSEDAATQRVMRDQMGRSEATWGGFFLAEPIGETFINVHSPVRSETEYLGYLVASVSIRELSNFLTRIANSAAANPFILYDKSAVVAHPAMSDAMGKKVTGINDRQPLPLLKDFDDPVLRSIWSEDRDHSLEKTFSSTAQVRAVHYLDETYIFFFQEVPGFADKPLIVGAYLPLEDAAQQIARINLIPMVGIAALVCALLTAMFLGRALSRPIDRLAATASHIQRLDIDGAPTLTKGLFRELNQTVDAFNAMITGLRAFETYVPRFLVSRLIEHHGDVDVVSENREITVLFTDIVGFTKTAESLPPPELAAYLNHHFTLVGQGVEAERGTIDKYIGDAVMAFWGAPETQDDQALRACRAAVAIASALRADNSARRAAGLEPARIRMGIHKGNAMVGNIGGNNRVNYTVIGDTVNVAERIESMSRELIDPELETGILVSDEVAVEIAGHFALRAVGRCHLKGKSEPITLHELIIPAN